MSNVRVLVVDDSAAMRALFCDILDQAKGVEVVGTAKSADDARDKIAELKPDVLTLDVEMPGMTGMEFLAELMATNPIPVVMLSSVTQEGTGTAQKARDLGAVDCFPKPLHSTPAQFQATVAKLGEIVIAAANTDLVAAAAQSDGASGGLHDYEPDGRIVVLAAASGSIEVMREIIAAYPANCPPTIILLDAEEDQAERAVDRLRPSVACKIEDAASDVMLVSGTVYLAYRKDQHVVIENDYAPLLKLVERDPIAGHRPSADMLLASLARAGLPALGGVLAGTSGDGARGLDALAKSGAVTCLQNSDSVGPNNRYEAVRAVCAAAEGVDAVDLPAWILAATRKQKLAA